jgi:hypothetical protein
MAPKTKTKTKTKTEEPADPPPDASFLGIPPEMRNAIYRLVADDIDEVNIIGHKLDPSKAASKDHEWLWDAIAKHPLSQTCRQLRQEFDPVHRRCALTTGVARYHLELEDFDVGRIKTFAKIAKYTPKIIRRKLKKTLDSFRPFIRFNLTTHVSSSIRNLARNWRDLGSPFSKLQRALDIDNPYKMYAPEVNLNFRTRSMSPAQKKLAPTQNLMTSAKSEFKKLCDGIHPHHMSGPEDTRRSAVLFERLYNQLNNAHSAHFRLLKEAREDRAKDALKERLRSELKAELRDELKEELRAEIMNEMNAEAEAELDGQMQ